METPARVRIYTLLMNLNLILKIVGNVNILLAAFNALREIAQVRLIVEADGTLVSRCLTSCFGSIINIISRPMSKRNMVSKLTYKWKSTKPWVIR